MDLNKRLIEEGPCHVGWFKAYKIFKEYDLIIHHFDLKKDPNPERVWGGSLHYKGNPKPELMDEMMKLNLFDERVGYKEDIYSDTSTQFLLVLKERDLSYIYETIKTNIALLSNV